MAALDIKKAGGGAANDWPALERFKTIDRDGIAKAALLSQQPLDLPDAATNLPRQQQGNL